MFPYHEVPLVKTNLLWMAPGPSRSCIQECRLAQLDWWVSRANKYGWLDLLPGMSPDAPLWWVCANSILRWRSGTAPTTSGSSSSSQSTRRPAPSATGASGLQGMTYITCQVWHTHYNMNRCKTLGIYQSVYRSDVERFWRWWIK